MAARNSLPRKLRVRLAELGDRVHRLHVVRGVGRLVFVILAAALAAVVADSLIKFPGWMRGLLFLGWLGLGAWEIRRFVTGPMSKPLDAEALASAIEQEFPRLGERLTTAVEVSASDDPASGSPELIDLVIRDAETRTRKLDLKRAAPATTAMVFAFAAVITIFAILLPLATVPRAGEFARRFFAPWYAPKPEAAYTINVTSGDPTVKRGETTTLTGLIDPSKPDAILPASATAVIKTQTATERVPMIYDVEKREVFVTRGPLEDGFEYQIVAGDAESDWHRVTIIDAIRLESSRITITPPAYAREPGKEPVPTDGLGEMMALQYSRVSYELKFNRMPSAAWIEWKPDVESGTPATMTKVHVSVAADATAMVSFVAAASGEVKLIAEADKVRTSFSQRLTVQIDTPPKFDRQVGVVDRPLEIRQNEKLQIDCTVSDDIAVAHVELEYRVDNGAVKTVRLPLQGLGTRKATGSYTFDFDGKAKEGQTFEYRLAATDNRNVPDAKLTPQKSYYPDNEKWAELKLRAGAAPLKEQDIRAKKEEIDARLKTIIEALKREKRMAYRLKIDTANRSSLTPEQSDQLSKLHGNVRETGDDIESLARDIEVTPDLALFAQAIREVGTREILDADGALLQSQRDPKSDARARSLAKADDSLEQAVRKLEALIKENEEVAKDRLDKQKIEQIAEEQKKLAEQTPKEDKQKLEELQAQQKELEERLKKLQEDSEPLKNAVEDLQAQQLEKTAKEAKRLEQELRDLNQAMQNVDRASRENRLADLQKRQDDLVKRAKELAEKTDVPSRTAPLSPLNKKEVDKAADELKNGNLNDAVTQQERAAQELDRLAKELEKAVARSKDPREAAKQLERLQEDLRNKLTEATKGASLELLPKDRREAIEKQQRAIQKAAEKLSVPRDAVDAENARKDAVEKAGKASDALSQDNAKKADEQMQKTREALAKLAEKLPTRETRWAQARSEIAKIRQEQEAIARQSEQTVKSVEKKDPDAAETQEDLRRKLAEMAKHQEQLGERLGNLDTPGHEARREKTEEALRQAKGDLDKGRPQDVGASQQSAKRELERLEQALNGQAPPDEQADRLAKRQKQLADEMKRNAQNPDPRKTNELQQQQAQQTSDAQKLPAPEAPATKEEAVEQSRKAEKAKTPEEAAKQAAEAAKALQKLADQINGRESESERSERLAKKQQDAADDAERLRKNKETSPDLRKKAQQMLDEAKNIRAGEDAQKEKQKALEALNRAQQASNPDQLAKADKEAAEAMRQLAEKMGKQPVVEKPNPKNDQRENVDGLPNQALTEEARKLAEEQRQLRDELARANEEMNKKQQSSDKNPVEDLVKDQEKLAKEAGELAQELRANQGGDKPEAKQAQQGANAAKQASGQLKNGQIPSAKDAGEQAAQKLEQLAQANPKSDQGKKAADLAKRQEEINRKLEEMKQDSQAAQGQQASRQKELQQQVADLARRMEQLGRDMKQPGAASKADDAAGKAKQAGEEMKGARKQEANGDRSGSRQSQEKAADALRQASQDLEDSAGRMAQNANPNKGRSNPQAGESLQDARNKMNQAQNQLGQGKQKDAGQSMQQAADSLKQAAGQMGKQGQQQPGAAKPGSTQPGANDGSGQKQTDLSGLGALGEKYKGKTWGELPGEIKDQIISDMKARYGEDYARYIKLYFEQLAERK